MTKWQTEQPVIYYGDPDAVARGETYECRPLDDDPFLVVHPDDLIILREQLPNVRFVHLRDKPPTPAEKLQARLRRMMELRREAL
jgi:hypothetical protein